MPAGRQDGRQARWDRHNQQRRLDILAAAVAVIEEGEPGAEVHVQQIAERAGLNRSVVYRHFDDRADLDRAVQGAILEDLWSRVLPGLALDGTIPEIVERIISTYVGWAVAHPALHRIAEQDTAGPDTSPLQEGLQLIAEQVGALILLAVDTLGLEISDDQREATDPLVFGLVGAVFGIVRRWVGKPERTPPAEVMVELTTRSVWLLLHGHARELGLELDPAVPVEELLGTTSLPEATS